MLLANNPASGLSQPPGCCALERMVWLLYEEITSNDRFTAADVDLTMLSHGRWVPLMMPRTSRPGYRQDHLWELHRPLVWKTIR